MIKNVIKNAVRATKAWEEFVGNYPDQTVDKYFHVRPKTTNIILVSTHKTRPMHGIIIAKTKLYEALCVVNDAISGDSVDWDAIKSGLSKDFGESYVSMKSPMQARMINEMHDNAELKDKLGVSELYFAASEILFQEKNVQESNVQESKRIDILGHDGAGKVFFFELKAPENKSQTPKMQVEKYLNFYGKGGFKNKDFENLMNVYPLHPIPSLDKYFCYAVVGYGEKIKSFASANGKEAGRIEME